MGKLPEKGKELVRSLSQHISPRNWDLSERAMHALRSIASIPGAKHAFEVGFLLLCPCLLSPTCPDAARHNAHYPATSSSQGKPGLLCGRNGREIICQQ